MQSVEGSRPWAETGQISGKKTISNRARDTADVLFKVGGLETTRAVLETLLSRTDVRQLLPEAVAKTRAQAADATTARAMLEAAKAFFNQLMGRQPRWVEGKWAKSKVHLGMTWVPGHYATGGRRSDTDRNAFWVSAAAMLPRDIFESRGGRKGYWLVKAQWYKLVQTSQRAYVLLPEIIQLNVNAMVRLPEPITFEPVKSRKQPKAKAPAEPTRGSDRLRTQAPPPPPPPPKPQREKHNYLVEPTNNVILSSLAQVRL